MFCKDDPYPPQRNFESKRVLAFSPTDGGKSPKESWTYRPREPESFLEEDLTLLSDTNETSNVSQESGVLSPYADGEDGDTPCVDQELLGSESAVRFWENVCVAEDFDNREDEDNNSVAGQNGLAGEKYRDRLSSLVFSNEGGQTTTLVEEEVARRLRFTDLLTRKSLGGCVNNNDSSVQPGNEGNKQNTSLAKATKEEVKGAGKRKTVQVKFVNDDQLLESTIQDVQAEKGKVKEARKRQTVQFKFVNDDQLLESMIQDVQVEKEEGEMFLKCRYTCR